MSAIMFDSDEAIQRLKSKGYTEDQARASVQLVRDAISELATKADLERGLQLLRTDLEAAIERAQTKLIMWLCPLLLAQSALIVTLVKLL